MNTARLVTCVLTAVFALGGCAHTREARWVWVDSLEIDAADARAFRIEPGDLLGIEVWKQDGLSADLKVRSDGRITLPLAGEVAVAGLTPVEATEVVAKHLEGFVVEPKVTVVVKEIRPIKVSVVGEVAQPGMYELDRGSGVLHALALAGGLSDFADHERIFVLARRDNARPVRFSYRSLVRAEGKASSYVLGAGDVVVVE